MGLGSKLLLLIRGVRNVRLHEHRHPFASTRCRLSLLTITQEPADRAQKFMASCGRPAAFRTTSVMRTD